MLRGLEIRDMLIIDRLEVEFQPGLNVLTGETGAGKSILLDALGFVLGWRGRADLVRQGAGQGEVTAWFDLAEGHPARAILDEAGLGAGDELILRRVNTRDGRKTAYVNDRRSSGDVLRRLSETLVELHGQQDDKGLLDIRGHGRLLDLYAGAEALLAETRAAWAERRKAETAIAEAQAAIDAARAEEEFLRYAVDELDKLAPEPGEEARLDETRRLMQAAGRVQEDVSRAADALGTNGAEGALANATRWLEGATEALGAHLDAPLGALSRALTELGEAQSGIDAVLDRLNVDPAELERTEERLFTLRAIARKHGVAADLLGAFAQDLRTRLEALDAGGATLDSLRVEHAAAEAAYAAAAQALTQHRQSSAQALDAAMADELAPLKMERAVFQTEIAPAPPGPQGSDAVSFTVATNPGAPAGPLNRIASGGELSRFLLALKVCLTADAPGLTLIFDEIDRGVGGATADAVGRRLARLAQGSQLLVVTHSPQVAALGNAHWRVEKQIENDITTSRVVPLARTDRVDEIARMLSGDTVTKEARAAARALLKG